MAEFINSSTVTISNGDNIPFINSVNCGKNCNIMHRNGSGIVTLRGSNRCCNPAKYKVSFGGNIAVATGGTAGPISVAIALSGEPLYAATATVTPAAIGDFFNVYTSAVVTVPCNCCLTIAVENTSTTDTAIDVANAGLIIERMA